MPKRSVYECRRPRRKSFPRINDGGRRKRFYRTRSPCKFPKISSLSKYTVALPKFFPCPSLPVNPPGQMYEKSRLAGSPNAPPRRSQNERGYHRIIPGIFAINRVLGFFAFYFRSERHVPARNVRGNHGYRGPTRCVDKRKGRSPRADHHQPYTFGAPSSNVRQQSQGPVEKRSACIEC